jgi:hypothetical protein
MRQQCSFTATHMFEGLTVQMPIVRGAATGQYVLRLEAALEDCGTRIANLAVAVNNVSNDLASK